jgi:hypothetical protein
MLGQSSMSDLEDERKREAARWLKIAIDDRAVAQICIDKVPPSLGMPLITASNRPRKS